MHLKTDTWSQQTVHPDLTTSLKVPGSMNLTHWLHTQWYALDTTCQVELHSISQDTEQYDPYLCLRFKFDMQWSWKFVIVLSDTWLWASGPKRGGSIANKRNVV
jgi:hypothetical protein